MERIGGHTCTIVVDGYAAKCTGCTNRYTLDTGVDHAKELEDLRAQLTAVTKERDAALQRATEAEKKATLADALYAALIDEERDCKDCEERITRAMKEYEPVYSPPKVTHVPHE